MDLLGKSAATCSLVLASSLVLGLALGLAGCDKKEERSGGERADAQPATKPTAPEHDDRDAPTDPVVVPPPKDDGASPPPPPDLEAKGPAQDQIPTGAGAGAEPDPPQLGGVDEGLGGLPPKPTDEDEGGADDVAWGVSFTPDQGTLILSFEADEAAPDTPKWCMDPERVLDRIETAVKDHEQCSIEKKFSLQQGGGFSYVCRSSVPDKPSCALSFAARLKIKRRGNSEVDYRIFGTADITRECSGSEAPFEPRREDIVAASTKGATGRLEEIVDQCSKKGSLQ